MTSNLKPAVEVTFTKDFDADQQKALEGNILFSIVGVTDNN